MEPAAALDPMTQTALRSLHDIVLPPPISWMPQTWGWAALAAIVILALLVWGLRAWKRYRKNAYRREALALLNDIETQILAHTAGPEPVCEVATVVKRVAIASWGREAVASLSGSDWARLVGEHADGGPSPALQSVLEDFEYHDPATLHRLPPSLRIEIVTAARQWVGGHHV